jgi:hypothetical protein
MSIVVVVIDIFEIILVLVLVIIKSLVVEGFTGEVVDCAGYNLSWMRFSVCGWLSDRDRYLFLEVLSDLIIHLKLLLELLKFILVDVSVFDGVFCRRDGWGEKVEE